MRLFFFLCVLSLIDINEVTAQEQRYRIDMIQNCQHENRTITFFNQVSFFRRWLEGRYNFRNQRVLNFASSYTVDTAFLEQQIEKIRKLLPTNFFKPTFTGSLFEGPKGERYNNAPDDQAIWFEQILSTEEKAGSNIVYAAYRITFDGNDARITDQRVAPKITNVQFIFNKEELTKIANRLKSLPVAQ